MSKPKGKAKKVDEIIRLGENSRKMMIWGLRYSLVYHLTQACRGFTKYGGVPYSASFGHIMLHISIEIAWWKVASKIEDSRSEAGIVCCFYGILIIPG